MVNQPKRCIFCGSTGMTKEHVLPDWLRAIFPRSPTDTHTFGAIDLVHLPTVGPIPIQSRKKKQGQAGSRKVKVVCGNCNNGWLSKLEQATKPVLERLVRGEAGVITATEQRQLAAWIAKTTMTAEFLAPTEVALTQVEREEFRQRCEPRASWQIWIGLYVGEKWRYGGIYHEGVGIYVPPRPMQVGVKNTQYTVIGLGHLLAVALSSEQDELSLGMHDQFKAAVLQLWPAADQDASWPSKWSINDAAAEKVVGAFAKAFGIPR